MKPLKLGVLGVSAHYGLRIHTPLMNSPLVELTAIGSREESRAAEAARKWDFKRFYASYQGVLDDVEVDAVYIPLPNDMHAEWIKKCADAGKAVLCEKPIALSTAEASDAFDYARKKGILVMEAFMYKFHPQWVRAKELIDAGEIGEIMSIHTIFSFYNDKPGNIRNQKRLGGGAMYDIGCYATSSARLLFGREPSRVAANMEFDPDLDVDILSSAILDFSGPRALFTVSTRMGAKQEVSIYGSKGSLCIVRPFNAYPDAPLTLIVDDGSSARKVSCGPADQYGLMFEAFAGALRKGERAPLPASDAIANMRVIDAVFKAAQSGRWEIL